MPHCKATMIILKNKMKNLLGNEIYEWEKDMYKLSGEHGEEPRCSTGTLLEILRNTTFNNNLK